jgi:hypothetical protein
MVQFNYMVDVDWFMSQLSPVNKNARILIVQGQQRTQGVLVSHRDLACSQNECTGMFRSRILFV